MGVDNKRSDGDENVNQSALRRSHAPDGLGSNPASSAAPGMEGLSKRTSVHQGLVVVGRGSHDGEACARYVMRWQEREAILGNNNA